MDADALRDKPRGANANRAVLYYLIFGEMRKVLGEEEAGAVMKRSIYRRGMEVSEPIRQFAPNGIRALGENHIAHSAGGGVFDPEVRRLDDEAFEVLNTTCPLKRAWQDDGLSDEEVAKMCDIGSALGGHSRFE